MADSPPSSDSRRDTGEDTDAESSHGSTTGAPRWVEAAGIIALVLVVLVGVMLLSGGGSHGPGRHTGGQPASSVTPSGGPGAHQSPAGGHTPPS